MQAFIIYNMNDNRIYRRKPINFSVMNISYCTCIIYLLTCSISFTVLLSSTQIPLSFFTLDNIFES